MDRFNAHYGGFAAPLGRYSHKVALEIPPRDGPDKQK